MIVWFTPNLFFKQIWRSWLLKETARFNNAGWTQVTKDTLGTRVNETGGLVTSRKSFEQIGKRDVPREACNRKNKKVLLRR